jgi:hypothetical protein
MGKLEGMTHTTTIPGRFLKCIVSCGVLVSCPLPRVTAEPIDFSRQIRPLLADRCFRCHGPDEATREADLRLDVRQRATAELDSGESAIVPGKPQESSLMARILSQDWDRMPPPEAGDALSRDEVSLLRRWIAGGAPYEQHWSFQRLTGPAVPAVGDSDRTITPVDAFVLDRLREADLRPSPEADRPTLIRRVSLDLTGLPPTVEEVDRFVADRHPGAYVRVVERLLASPAFGERWGRVWLDLSRYADSAGYAQDPPRTIWRFRDWVIRALNDNLPFDEFTIEQLAGDLLPRPSNSQLIATAFHRNTMTNSEGGTDDEEFRVAAVVDRVNTTIQVWMGLTMGCAQCHSHKYDPISQEEYFRVFAILNNTADTDRGDEQPVLEIEGVPTPIMRELPPDQHRTTYVHVRGNFRMPGQQVVPGVPAAFHAIRTGPRDAQPDRLALARWLTSPENPLTARVAVNRLWEQLFGRGLVATSEDFGTQGELPTHPRLLDYLASELIRCGWDRKALLRQIVLSATYRQSSRVTPQLRQLDPQNELLARGPRFRLPAEMIRDQALAVSGLLSRKMYGPSVRPPRPQLGLRAAFGGSTDWETSPGEDRYRRGLYTQWRRTTPYPSLTTFDAPSREVCTVRRISTNTPLQALVTLNDPVFVEAAQALARRVLRETPGADARQRVGHAFRLVVSRKPTEDEAHRLAELLSAVAADCQNRPEAARALATVPLGPAPAGVDLSHLAAWTVASNVLLNLDETLARP